MEIGMQLSVQIGSTSLVKAIMNSPESAVINSPQVFLQWRSSVSVQASGMFLIGKNQNILQNNNSIYK